MADKTGIEWTDATWNPLRGCSRISEGCRNCYAERVAARWSQTGMPYEGLAWNDSGGSHWTNEVRFIESVLDQPLRWKKPRRIFVNSMSDLFHEKVPDEWIDRIFAVMALAPQHTFQILTKRPERMKAYLDAQPDPHAPHFARDQLPLSNIWLGVSVEDQKTAEERIPLLLGTPAARRFISAEPLLGPVDLTDVSLAQSERLEREKCGLIGVDALTGAHWDAEDTIHGVHDYPDRHLDWVICGGESGPAARPMHPDWARSLRDQCAAAGVPFFFKQWGEWADVNQPENNALVMESRERHFWSDKSGQMMRIGKHRAGSLLDGREHKEFPA